MTAAWTYDEKRRGVQREEVMELKADRTRVRKALARWMESVKKDWRAMSIGGTWAYERANNHVKKRGFGGTNNFSSP